VTSLGPVDPGGSTTSGSITTSNSGEPNAITNFTVTVTSPAPPGNIRLDWTPPTNPSGIGLYTLYFYDAAYGFGFYINYVPTGLPPILTGGSPGDYFGISALFYDMTYTPYVYASVP
jgi:hypothetical protein